MFCWFYSLQFKSMFFSASAKHVSIPRPCFSGNNSRVRGSLSVTRKSRHCKKFHGLCNPSALLRCAVLRGRNVDNYPDYSS